MSISIQSSMLDPCSGLKPGDRITMKNDWKYRTDGSMAEYSMSSFRYEEGFTVTIPAGGYGTVTRNGPPGSKTLYAKFDGFDDNLGEIMVEYRLIGIVEPEYKPGRYSVLRKVTVSTTDEDLFIRDESGEIDDKLSGVTTFSNHKGPWKCKVCGRENLYRDERKRRIKKCKVCGTSKEYEKRESQVIDTLRPGAEVSITQIKEEYNKEGDKIIKGKLADGDKWMVLERVGLKYVKLEEAMRFKTMKLTDLCRHPIQEE